MKVKKIVLLLIVLGILFSATTAIYAAQVWKPMNISCARGAQIGISASGLVTTDFWYYTPYSTQRYRVVTNFGAGQSRTITTSFSAPYAGVQVTGSNLLSVGNPRCR